MADLDRSSLPERLAELLEKEITSGVWTDRLPGYRVLCQKYGVSRPTCEEAFRILERQGVLGPARPRRTRRILQQESGGIPSPTRHLLVVTSKSHVGRVDFEQIIDPCTGFWRENGGETTIVEGDLERRKRPESLLGQWIRDAGADCLLLYMPSKFWLRAAKRSGLPCYSLGGDRSGVTDWASGNGFALPQFLASFLKEAFQMGHQRILIPFSRMLGEPDFRDSMLSLVNENLKKHGLDEALTLSVEAPRANTPADWHAWWPQIVTRIKPSLVILRDCTEAISFHCFCLENRIRMPDDISLVVIDESPYPGWLNPPPAQFAFPHKKAHRHFQSWVRRGFPAGYWRNFDVEFVGGETLGPVR